MAAVRAAETNGAAPRVEVEVEEEGGCFEDHPSP